MIYLRKSDDRGLTQTPWLNSHHTFSFGDYWDPGHMGVGALRVINEDLVEPGQGFGMHPHRDMEIITYIVSGALEHKDSLGTSSVIKEGDIQVMTAGTGVRHSEFNPSQSERVHLLQIWVLPEEKSLEPGYRQKHFDRDQKQNRLCLLVSRKGTKNSLNIHQDVNLYASILSKDHELDYKLRNAGLFWLQAITGRVSVNGMDVEPGDGIAGSEINEIKIRGLDDEAEFLLFDLG